MTDFRHDLYLQNHLKPISLADQEQRRFLGDRWEPRGSERFVYQKALGDQMDIVGGSKDRFEPIPRRYKPATSCQDTLDCHCGSEE